MRIGLDDDGPFWSGHYYIYGNDRWTYDVRASKAIFGSEEFDLGEGEIFILFKDFSIKQIAGSKAGSTNDRDNLKRLATLLANPDSEQAESPKP